MNAISRRSLIPLFRAILVAMSTVGLVGCTGSDHSSRPTPPAFIKEGDPMDCSRGYKVSIQEATIFEPGAETEDSYTTSGVRVEDGIEIAYLGGGNKQGGIGARLAVGQSVTHEGVGTFTLLSISLEGKQPGVPGAGGSATFCFEPAPGYEVRSNL